MKEQATVLCEKFLFSVYYSKCKVLHYVIGNSLLMKLHFYCLYRFLYSDNVALTLDIVSPVIYAAKKYSIVALENKCSDYLSDNLCPENAFNVLIQVRIKYCYHQLQPFNITISLVLSKSGAIG